METGQSGMWSTVCSIENHPMKGEFHCWLYHCLYDHMNLSWDDILRIGMIWVDIIVFYQHMTKIQ